MSHIVNMKYRDNSSNETRYDYRKYIDNLDLSSEPYSINGFFPLYSTKENALEAGARTVTEVKNDNVTHYLAVKDGTAFGNNADQNELEGLIEWDGKTWRPDPYAKVKIVSDISDVSTSPLNSFESFNWTQGTTVEGPVDQVRTAWGSNISVSDDGSILVARAEFEWYANDDDLGSGNYVYKRDASSPSGWTLIDIVRGNNYCLSGDGRTISVGQDLGIEIYEINEAQTAINLIHTFDTIPNTNIGIVNSSLSADGLIISFDAYGSGAVLDEDKVYIFERSASNLNDWTQVGNPIKATGSVTFTYSKLSSDGKYLNVDFRLLSHSTYYHAVYERIGSQYQQVGNNIEVDYPTGQFLDGVEGGANARSRVNDDGNFLIIVSLHAIFVAFELDSNNEWVQYGDFISATTVNEYYPRIPAGNVPAVSKDCSTVAIIAAAHEVIYRKERSNPSGWSPWGDFGPRPPRDYNIYYDDYALNSDGTMLMLGYTDANFNLMQGGVVSEFNETHTPKIYTFNGNGSTTPITKINVSSVGATLSVNLKTDRGANINKTVVPANVAGKGNGVSFPNVVDVYSRHDLIIYLGDDYSLSLAPIYTDEFREPNIAVQNTSYNKIFVKQSDGLSNAGWADFSPEAITGEGFSTNVLHRMLYQLELTKQRGTSVLGFIDKDLPFDLAFSKGTEPYDYIINNIDSEIQNLFDNYIQARVRMVILNLGRKETRSNYVDHLGQFIQDIRSDLGQKDLPVLITKYDFLESSNSLIDTEHESLILDYNVSVAETMQGKAPSDNLLSPSEIIALGDEYADIVTNVLEPKLDFSRLGTSFWFKADSYFTNLAINSQTLYDRATYFVNEELSQEKSFTILRDGTTSDNYSAAPPQEISEPLEHQKNNGFGVRLNRVALKGQAENIFGGLKLSSGAIIATLRVYSENKSYFHITQGDSINADGSVNLAPDRFLSHLVWENGEVYFDAGHNPNDNMSSYRVQTYASDASHPGKMVSYTNAPVNLLVSYTFDIEDGIRLRINGKEVDYKIGVQREIILRTLFTLNGYSGSWEWSSDLILYELMLFNKWLSPQKVEAIEGQLAQNWNLELPDTHPYKI